MLYSSSCAALASQFNPISSIGYSSSCSSCNHFALGLSSRRRIVLLAAAAQLRASDEKENRIGGGSGVRGELVRCGRREMVKRAVLPGAALLISMTVAGSVNAAPGEVEGPAAAAKNELIQKLLERSRANKAKNDKERLDDFYKRNYKEYFEFVEGSVRNKKELSEAEKGIVEWLAKHK
ncbi:hypothetical protein BDL97_11G047700 [Sphagnum fallax]|nr:hypothetical protein BDL97_11G047700 [Sphagnum fallax]